MIFGFFQRMRLKQVRKAVIREQLVIHDILSDYNELEKNSLPPKEKMLIEMRRVKELTRSSSWREEAVMDGIVVFIDKYNEANQAAISTIKAIISHGDNFIVELNKLEQATNVGDVGLLAEDVWDKYQEDVLDQLHRTSQYFYAFVDNLKRQFDCLPDEKIEIQRGSFLEDQKRMMKKEEAYCLERIRLYEEMARDLNNKSTRGILGLVY